MGHGITPGVASLEILPQALPPDLAGPLVISDGIGIVTLPDCRVDSIRAEKDSGGIRYYLTIKDRRWRWKNCGGISGRYNVVDPSGQYSKITPNAFGDYPTRLARPTRYIPWTLKTPYQLAILCLTAMRETAYTVDLPNTVDTLPQINWDWTNPAQALQSLCNQFGRRIIYDWFTDTVNVVQLGIGLDLPTGSYSLDTPAYTNLQRPDSIILVGAPIRYQILMKLEAVGEDWDGSIRPINDLSYVPAPFLQGSGQQKWEILITNPADGVKYVLDIVGNFDQNELSYVGRDGSLTNAYNGLAAVINGLPNVLNGMTAAVVVNQANQTVLQLTVMEGTKFTITGSVVQSIGTTATLTITTSGPKIVDEKWRFSGPPDYANANPTDQLTLEQAKAKARKSVFKWYRVVPINPDNEAYPYFVPGFGPVFRKEQFLLQRNQVVPLLPKDTDENFITQQGEPYQQVVYDSTYRTRPARCYGSFAVKEIEANGLIYTKFADYNTDIGSLIPIPFEIDQETQTVRFSEPVYQIDTDGGFLAADIFLETAVQILDPVSNAVTRYVKTFTFPGPPTGSPPLVIRREDVQANVINSYDYAQGILTGTFPDTDYADTQAAYYLSTAASQYFTTLGTRRNYNGIVPLVLDGYRQQITWEVGPNGAHTVISTNGEHEIFYPSYPERLRLEYLSAPQLEKAENENPANKGKGITEPME